MKADLPPKRPQDLHPLAAAMLQELQEQPGAADIVLGGGVALKHYLDLRPTNDIDAWWRTTPKSDTLEAIRNAAQAVSDAQGLTLEERSFGDTLSFDFFDPKKNQKVFSFQIAVRDVALEPPLQSPWGLIQIETLCDNIGSKMNALVNRGAPRDFIDIKALVDHHLATVADLWALWKAKNPDLDLVLARKQVGHHLASIEMRRPLETLPVLQQAPTQKARQWFRENLVGQSQQ
jgi:hypothetical protein